jgi:hypothetical protein
VAGSTRQVEATIGRAFDKKGSASQRKLASAAKEPKKTRGVSGPSGMRSLQSSSACCPTKNRNCRGLTMKVELSGAAEKPTQGWPEIDRLYHRLLTALYEKNDPRRAGRIAPRLRALVMLHDPSCHTVLGAAARSVLSELEGDLWTAIRAREREISLLRHLASQKTPEKVAAGPAEISDRLDLLAGLYWRSGELEKAEKLLRESQRLCATSGIKFDGQQMLKELMAERRALARQRPSPKRRAS